MRRPSPGYGNTNTTSTHLFGEAYNRAGTYYYRITENVGNQGGITYDTAERRFSVQVADSDMDGDLEIVAVNNEVLVTVSGNWLVTANGSIVFENTYKAAPADINLGGKKVLVGRELRDGEFTFNLYFAVLNNETGRWEKDALVEQTTNNADGSFKFETRISDENAEYIYFITEDATNSDPTITYDTEEYMVKVNSVDNLDGTRSLTYEYIVGGAEISEVVFTNTYTAPTEVPKTGDDGISGLWLWIALAFVSTGGIFATGKKLLLKET